MTHVEITWNLGGGAPSADSTLTCIALADDPDGDDIDLFFEWRVNGLLVAVASNVLGPSYISTGDEVECVVVADDGYELSSPASGTVVVL